MYDPSFGKAAGTGIAVPSTPAPAAPISTPGGYDPTFGGKASAPAPVSTVAPDTTKYFQGKGYGAAVDTDPSSGKPYLTVEDQAGQRSVLDTTRTATTFDPTVPQKLDSSTFSNSMYRAPSLRETVGKRLGIQPNEELDHKIALELGGTSNTDNLQREKAKDPSKPYSSATNKTPTDPLENELAHKVASGDISYQDAQGQLAAAKHFSLVTPNGQPSPSAKPTDHTDIPATLLKYFPSTIQTLANMQTNPLGFSPQDKSLFERIKADTWDLAGNTEKDLAHAAANFVNTIQSNRSLSEKIGTGLDVFNKSANLAFSPITMLFKSASELPIAKTATDLVTVPFSAAGDTVGDIFGAGVNALPISDQAKQNLSEPVKQLGALAGQILIGELAAHNSDPVKQIANSTDPAKITSILIKNNVPEELAPSLAKTLKDVSNPKEVANTIKTAVDGYVKTARATPKPAAYDPSFQKSDFSRAGSIISPDAATEGLKQTVRDAKDYLAKSAESSKFSGNIEDDLNRIQTSAKADEIRAKELLSNSPITPKDAEAIYHYVENPEGEKLTAEQKTLYEDNIKPIQDARQALYEKLKNDGLPIDESNYTPRFVEDRGNIMDRLKDSVDKTVGGIRGVLNKSVGAFKHRTMQALVDEQGNRTVAAIKNGRVTAFEGGTARDLGNFKLDSNADILDRETKSIDGKMKNLQSELDTLTATKGRSAASPKRIENIKAQMVDLTNQRANIEAKYNPNELNRKIFTDNTGKRYTVTDATTKEIEANTNLRYHKNILLNELVTYNKLRQIDRATSFLESLKATPDFQRFSVKLGEGNVPNGWKMSDLPQFRGYAFDPKIADTLNHFYAKMKGGDILKPLTAINSYLRTAIFFQPFLHVPNIAVHWLVNRGISKFAIPGAYLDLARTSDAAVAAILHPDEAPRAGLPSYTELLDRGASLQYSGTTKTLTDLMREKMGEELQQNPSHLKQVADALGYANPKKLLDLVFGRGGISSKVTWFTNDLASVQAIYEEMLHGKTAEEAISETGKHIPNYRIPARVLGSRALSEAMTNPNITMFSAYHYGAIRSYGEMTKSLLGKVPLSERATALDKLAMLGLITTVIYPQLDKLAQTATGNPAAKMRRAGASTVPYNLVQLARGKTDYATFLQSILTPSVGTELIGELATNRDFHTGDQLIRPGSAMSDLGTAAGKSIAPVYQAQQLADGSKSIKDFLLGTLGISNPKSSPSVANLNQMLFTERAQRDTEMKAAVASGDTAKANQIATDFNQRLLQNAIDAYKENGHTITDLNALKQYLISTGLKASFLHFPTAKQMGNYSANKKKTPLQKTIK